jgi:hypothetical protein
MQDVVEGDVMAAVGNLQLQVDPQESCSAEYKNRVALATGGSVTVTASMLAATLKDKAVNFEEMKARAIEIILWHKARGTQLGLVSRRKDKRKMEKSMDGTA